MPSKNSKTGQRLVLVTGATGHQGGAAARHLRQNGFPVRALTRDPNKPQAHALMDRGVEVVSGDMDDAASLARALDGVYGVHSVQSFREVGTEGEIRQGMRVADAANRSNAVHIVYSSVAAADQNTGIPHFESKFRIERHISDAGIPYTIVRPVFFMENWLSMRSMIEGGTISLPLNPDTRLQMVAVDDIGGVVAAAFERPGKWQDRIFELAGDELSMIQLAQAFTRVSGREVSYRQLPWDQFERQAGKEMTLMYRWFERTGYHVDIRSVRQEYPNLTGFDQWLDACWHSATATGAQHSSGSSGGAS